METTIKDIKIAFDTKNQVVPQYIWSGNRSRAYQTSYYHNVVFEDEFEIDGFHNSRSSVYITIRSVNTGVKYFMRWWAMKDLLKNAVLNQGKFKGIFTMKHAWDYTTVVMFDPKKLKEGVLAGPNWWDYARPWGDDE